MTLPNFFLIGTMKAGTTALWHALSQHPDIFMAPDKEPHYFAIERPEPPRAGSDAAHYLAVFNDTDSYRVVGEASVGYIASPPAARRIRHNVPDAKLVAILRQPVQRAHSHYWHQVQRGVETASSFEHALELEPSRPDSGQVRAGGRRAWLDYRARGYYHAQLTAYLRLFDRGQLRLYLYEDWCDRPHDLLADLFAFLAVDPGFTPRLRRHLVSHAVRSPRLHRLALRTGGPRARRIERRLNNIILPPINRRTWYQLLDGYRDDIDRLQTLLGRDLTHWLSGPPGRR